VPLTCRRRTPFAVLLSIMFCASGALAVPAGAQTTPQGTKSDLGSRALRVGASGSDVRQLQQLLTKVGIKVKTDGQFGPDLKKAVQRFQRAANLEASGTVGTKTITALQRAASGAQTGTSGGYDPENASQSTKSLGDRIPVRKGMSGHDIKVLQDFLRRLGYKVTVDGEFGAGTVKAVKAFESASGLTADGIVDAQDIDALRGQITPRAGDEQNLVDTTPAGAQTTDTVPVALAPGDTATVGSDGLATAPTSAPDAVKQIIAAGNAIAKTPYVYGGGHASWNATGYDCSGSVSYALHAAGLLDKPLVSGDFPSWGEPGPGQWVTIYGNSGHVYMVVAGLRFDTSGAKQDGSRWHKSTRTTSGYGVSHPTGL
jgi:peptidoglycan hydrolase-like protein with peptidoglycan-binding domain